MYLLKVDRSLSGRVSPFRYLRIDVYLPLPAAFRSLSRLSSALSAKASTLRSYSLNLPELACSVDCVFVLVFFRIHKFGFLGCLYLLYVRLFLIFHAEK